MRRLLKLFFELGEIGIGVGGVEVSNQEAAGTGGDGLLQAQFGVPWPQPIRWACSAEVYCPSQMRRSVSWASSRRGPGEEGEGS